jgi:hypothetical protein
LGHRLPVRGQSTDYPILDDFVHCDKTSIIGSATPDEGAYRAKRLNYPNNNAFDKSGVYSKSLEVADAVIKACDNTEDNDESRNATSLRP